jgi:hypothetical protein
MQRPFEEVLLRTVQVGSPPQWDDVPAEFQSDLSALDRLDDATLWRIARARQTPDEMVRYQELLDKKAEGELTAGEAVELTRLRTEADRFMLRKAHAAALLRWRGHAIPPAERL